MIFGQGSPQTRTIMKRRLSSLAAIVALLAGVAASPAGAEPRHGLSVFGELKYPADFQHFEYVNPDAPKGGRMVTMGTGGANTFDTLNQYILKGDAAQGLDFLFDSLMVRAQDEPDAVYGLIAKSADVALDGMSVTFKLRPEAKFSDGTPVTAADVAFSFAILKEKGHPSISLTLHDVVAAEAIDPETVRYTFKGTLTRDLPTLVAQLPVLSKAYYTTQPFEETSLKPPLGSGPYRIKDFNPGTYITYTRRDDYWAKDLPVNKGRYNFDEIRYDYYRDRNIELEALKSGGFDFREEFSSSNWATGYDIPAVRDGRLIKTSLPDNRPSGAQGYFLNLRRDKFQDPRVRQALDLVFDFEWSNKKLFYGLYKRTTSYFENSDMKAVGVPSPEELALLDPYKDKLAAEVFGEPYTPPVTDGSGNNRDNLKKARDLLVAAGWMPGPDHLLHNAKGEPLTIEFLDYEAMFERITGPYTENLKKIGVDASWRLVDPAQYERRVKSFDFDVATQRYSLRLTPGVEMRSYWGSEAAKMDGSFNLPGISDPVIDALIDKVMAAKSRAELTTATRAIDRVLRAGHYWVPHWYKASYGIAYWNKYSRPAVQPKYDAGILDTWWYDPQKAAALNSGKPEAQPQTRTEVQPQAQPAAQSPEQPAKP
jgi:microcin C transport system substrate-binding protein